MIQKFEEKGYKIVNSEEEADIYIINTCTVTNMSDRKSRQMLRRAHELNKDAIIVAVGCYADVAKEELSKIKEINLILGNSEKKNIVDHVENYINHNDVNIESSEEYTNKELWLKFLLEEIETEDVQKIADIILQEAIDNNYGKPKDDMTVIVARVNNK